VGRWESEKARYKIQDTRNKHQTNPNIQIQNSKQIKKHIKVPGKYYATLLVEPQILQMNRCGKFYLT